MAGAPPTHPEPLSQDGLLALFDGKGGILHCQGRVRQERIDRRPDLMDRLSGVRRWWGRRDLASAWAPRLSDR